MKRLALCLLLAGAMVCGYAKVGIPPVPNPPRLVNDLAGVLPPEQVSSMEQRLVAFNDSTTNVICVVTVDNIGTYSAAQFAYEIGEQWGVRSKDKRNGVVILIKPRNDHGDGEVYISVGYDLEGAIPDAIAKRIIERKMIPELKEERYGAAIDSALAYILPLAAGEISADDLEDDGDGVFAALVIVLILVIVVVLIVSSKNNNTPHRSDPFSGNADRGFFGPYYTGGGFGGGFGGGRSGGFGGFGGFGGSGGFGGGGAGGRF